MNRLRAVFCFLGRARCFACEWLVATLGEEVSVNPFKSRSEKVKSPFAEFIRNAKADEKKRVYTTVLIEATKRQNEIMVAAQENSV